ncbi:hypothetical protein Kostya_41 [Mycobacterium phage Kostya]|uniref:Uncharacterized protein n=1 Tax=Mycobacterium phage Kostya TaxID=2914016 RepID=B5A703_9CAUD|nr:hypothetical protein Kostya_41 [Mycobacterium phage Kostya]ACF34208.1 hypothetical protein Kostya_41 [Mycobacterium phage Kostya]
MSDGRRCARCGRADSVFGSWTYFVAPDRMRTVYLCHANQDGTKTDPDCYHLATTLRDPMPDHYQNPCGWSEEGDGVHTAHVAYEVDKALGGLTREEQWVPVEESGHRWLGRSEDEAAWALENYSKDGDSHDPDMDSPLTHIAHEARWVSGWSEAPREVERPHSAMSANDDECGDDCRNPEHYELKA